jgi:quinol monooxygenase YgiN
MIKMRYQKSLLLLVGCLLLCSTLSYSQDSKRDLNENVFILVELAIKPGQFEKFLEVANYMSEVVKTTEAAAQVYEWTISQDSSKCHILERYSSSEATIAHSALFREQFAKKLGEVADIQGLHVYGNPSHELIKLWGLHESGYYQPVAGFSR